MKKLIKPAQGFIIITCILAVLFYIGRFGALELDKTTQLGAMLGCAISVLYIIGAKAVYKVLDSYNDN